MSFLGAIKIKALHNDSLYQAVQKTPDLVTLKNHFQGHKNWGEKCRKKPTPTQLFLYCFEYEASKCLLPMFQFKKEDTNPLQRMFDKLQHTC